MTASNRSTAKAKPCIVADCKRPAQTRGVCGSCYVHARVMVLNNETSWQELEDMGLVKPAHHVAKNPLKVAFLSALEKRNQQNGRKKAGAR